MEACPASNLDTYNGDYNFWVIGGAAKFQSESTDGFSSPYGNIHMHFYGNENRGAQLIQPPDVIGDMVQGQTYTLTFAMKITKNDGISTEPNYLPCYLNADFAYQQFWRRDFTSADS